MGLSGWPGRSVFWVEVFTEDPRPYILNGQPGPGRVPIYYFGSRVCLTLCVIPESIGEHRTCQWSVSVGTLCVFCKIRMRKVWAGIRCKKKTSVVRDLSRKKQSAGGVNTSGRSVIMDSFMSDVKKKLRQNEYKEVKSSG